MFRSPTPAAEQTPEKSKPLLAAVWKQLLTVPNLFRIVANSPAALQAYFGAANAP